MPTALVRSLRSPKPYFLEKSLQSYKAGHHCIITPRPVWCQRLPFPQVDHQFTRPGRKEDFSLFSFLSSPSPNEKKATTHFFSIYNRGILPREYFSLLKMEEGKGKESIEENLKKSSQVAKVQEEEKLRLQKEQEKKRKEKKEEEERNRVKEQEMEDKIGPPPEKPLAGDCCGQGCEVCVWDTYWDELDIYKKLRKAAEAESG